jgi:hypothetical protein
MLLRLGIFGPSTRSIVLIVTEEFVADLGSFRWERRSPIVIKSWCIPVKNTTGQSTVTFCAYEIMQIKLDMRINLTSLHGCYKRNTSQLATCGK